MAFLVWRGFFFAIDFFHRKSGGPNVKRILVITLIMSLCALPLKPAERPDSSIQSLAFLSGLWTEHSAEGDEEEYWSKPMGSSMVGTFRVVKDGDAVFYEFWAIEVEDGEVVFKMKHFNKGLIGWEEKVEMVRLTMSIGGMQDVLFSKPDGSLSLRYQRKGDELISTLQRVKDGKTKEDVFHLHRSK
jgi:hypothetical protein